jgi:hypothetical protein
MSRRFHRLKYGLATIQASHPWFINLDTAPQYCLHTDRSDSIITRAVVVRRRQTPTILVIIRIPKVLGALKQTQSIPTGAKIISRIIDIRLMLQILRIRRVNPLRNTIGANGRRIAIVEVADIRAVAGVVGVVADTGTPGVAFCAEVELPPDAVEDVGAGIAAVHL